MVSWKQRIRIVVLVIVAALPVSGTLCVMVCDSAAKTASAHHGSDKDCDEAARPSDGLRIQGVPDRDCSNHDAVVRQVATAAAERIGLQTAPALFASLANQVRSSSPSPSAMFEYTSPPGTAPPTTTPLVLRV